MYAHSLTELVELEQDETAGIRAGIGSETVALAVLFTTAMTAGFSWGYEHLGPQFNKYF